MTARDPTLLDLRPVSRAPPGDPALRDAARLIAMVHELHKAGYQRIRICPAMAPSGCYWRCTISDAANLGPDGLEFRGGAEGRVAAYTSGQGAKYFGWADGGQLSARAMARRFLHVFPLIAEKGAGRDWAYAGWLTDVLGYAEHGQFIYFYADYPVDPAMLERWRPPPPPTADAVERR